jgi:hypothetical protein
LWHIQLCPQLQAKLTGMNRVIGFINLLSRDKIAAATQINHGGCQKLAMLVSHKTEPIPKNPDQSYFVFSETNREGRAVVNLSSFRNDVPFGMSMFPDEVDQQKIFSNLAFYKAQEPLLKQKLIESEFNLDGTSDDSSFCQEYLVH